MRPSRGRPNKVMKPVPPGRGRPPRQNLVAHEGALTDATKVDIDADAEPYPDATLSDQYAAAAVAAAAAVHQAELDADGEAEGDTNMEDTDPASVAAAIAQHAEHIDLNTAANILANGGAGGPADGGMQHHPQSSVMGGPQHLSGNHMDPSLVKTCEDVATDSGYGGITIESALAKRLAREPGLRLAQQRRPEQQLNLGRRSNVEALFAHIAGDLATVPCKNCHKGHGPWNACVVVDGQMCGSCANCWFNASGARCSFHETRNPIPHHQTLMPAGNHSVGDPTAHFAMPPAMMSAGRGPPPMAAAYNLDSMPMHQDARFTIDRALADVRAADKKTRCLIAIDIAAKQLALSIAEYEDIIANEEVHDGNPSEQQQVMGDDGGA